MRKFYNGIGTKSSGLLMLALLLIAAGCNKPRYDLMGGTDEGNPFGKHRKVLIIGISGGRGDVILKAPIPNIRKMLANSIYSFDALTEAPTLESTGWSSTLTGVWGAKHGVVDEGYAGNDFDKYPMLFKHIKEFNAKLKTVSISADAALNTSLVSDADVKESLGNGDLAVKDKALTALADVGSDVVLVNFKGVDAAGDQYGFDASIPQYMQAISTADSYVGELLAAVESRASIKDEDWLIVISSDHGGTLSGHGGNEYESRNIFTVFYNRNFNTNPIVKSQTNTTFLKINQVDGLQYAYSDSSLYKFNKYPKFTFEMRVKVDVKMDSDPAFVSNKDWGNGGNPGWGIFVSGQKWKFNVGDGISANRRDINPLGTTSEISDGKWHHIAVSVDKSGFARTYQDGVFLAEINVSGVTNWEGNQKATLAILEDGTINSRNEWGYELKANFADVRLWNTVIDPSTLATYAKCDTTITPNHPYYENLLGWWKGNDAKGEILKDYSLRNSNLKIFGAPKWEETGKNLCSAIVQADVPKTVDVTAQVYSWLRIPIRPEWSLDGKVWINN
jgi:hypothetical protein